MLNQKDRRKTIFAANDMILYTENPVASTKKLLEVINKFSKAVGYKKKKAGENVGNREHLYTASVNIKWCSPYGKQYRQSFTFWPQFPHLQNTDTPTP